MAPFTRISALGFVFFFFFFFFFFFCVLLSDSSSAFRIYIGAVVERLRPQVRLYITEHVPARDMLHAVRPDLER